MICKHVVVGLGVVALAAGMAGPTLAQNGNVIIVEQISDSITNGNTLNIDQSNASNSLVAGVPAANDFGLSLDPGSSTGNFVVFGSVNPSQNTGGQNMISTLSETSAATQSGNLNSGDITLSGNGAFAGLEQSGARNKANIGVDGDFAGGIIVQQGNDNQGTVNVQENGAFGELIQIGDSNNIGFAVSGSPNSSVSFSVQGNNVSTNIPASVVTNSGGQVTIVQRQLGGFN